MVAVFCVHTLVATTSVAHRGVGQDSEVVLAFAGTRAQRTLLFGVVRRAALCDAGQPGHFHALACLIPRARIPGFSGGLDRAGALLCRAPGEKPHDGRPSNTTVGGTPRTAVLPNKLWGPRLQKRGLAAVVTLTRPPRQSRPGAGGRQVGPVLLVPRLSEPRVRHGLPFWGLIA